MKRTTTVAQCIAIMAFLPMLAGCGAGGGSDRASDLSQSATAADAGTVPNAAGAGDAQSWPFQLSVRGLMDVNHSTDVEIVVTATDSRFAAPASAQHILLKSTDSTGTLRWSRSLRNIALTPLADGRSSNAVLTFADLARGQVIGAQLQVHSGGDADDREHGRGADAADEGEDRDEGTFVLRAAGRVMLRPDVTVVSVTAPAQAAAGQSFTITATLREANGDLGADTTLSVSNQGETLDTVANVHVNPGATTTVMLAAALQRQGTYTLLVTAGAVTPGDFDGSNNSGTVTVRITGGTAAVPSSLHYDRQVTESRSTTTSSYDGVDTTSSATVETARQSLTIPHALTFPIERVDVQLSGDGAVKASFAVASIALSSTATSADGCIGYAYGGGKAGSAGNQTVSVTVVSNACAGAAYTEVVAQQQASESVYSSTKWAIIFSSATTSSGKQSVGTPLGASASVAFRTVVTNRNSAAGGTLGAAVTAAPPVVNSWDYWTAAGSHERGSATVTTYTAEALGTITP